VRAAPLEITARDPAGRARAGLLRTAHGVVRTPAFVPLATKAVVKGLESREVAALGYDMVLGNTFHLLLEPGHELIRGFGGLHDFMGWDRPIITDSGGYQVFSMGHGNVADEIKKTRPPRAPYGSERDGAVLGIEEEGVTFRNPRNGDRSSWGRRRRWRSRPRCARPGARLRRVHAVPRRRDYTARSTERTHRWLDRCLAWHGEHGPPASSSTASSRAGRSTTCASRAPGRRRPRGRRDRDRRLARRRQAADARGRRLGDRGARRRPRPRHLLGIGEVDDLIRGVELGIDTFDCVTPTRLGRHGVVLVADPERRWRVDLTAARFKLSDEPIEEGCPCPACAGGHSRGYLRYLAKNREPTGQRLLTLHNLAFLARLMRELRDSVLAGPCGDGGRPAGRRRARRRRPDLSPAAALAGCPMAPGGRATASSTNPAPLRLLEDRTDEPPVLHGSHHRTAHRRRPPPQRHGHSVRDEDTSPCPCGTSVLRARRRRRPLRAAPGLDLAVAALIVDNRRRGSRLRHAPPARLTEDEIDAAAALIEAAAAVLACWRPATPPGRLAHRALNHGAMLAAREEIDRAAATDRPGVPDHRPRRLQVDQRQWGHATGDSVLRQVATLLRTEFRAHDQVAATAATSSSSCCRTRSGRGRRSPRAAPCAACATSTSSPTRAASP
jgi:queuine tRNA-ribosyltransferase